MATIELIDVGPVEVVIPCEGTTAFPLNVALVKNAAYKKAWIEQVRRGRWEKSRGLAEVLWVVTPPSW